MARLARRTGTGLGEMAIAALATVLTLLLAGGWPFGITLGRRGFFLTLAVVFAAVGVAPLPWRRAKWQVALASFLVALLIVGFLTWSYRAGIMRFNPAAWRFGLEYAVSVENLPVGLVACTSAVLAAIARRHVGHRGSMPAR